MVQAGPRPGLPGLWLCLAPCLNPLLGLGAQVLPKAVQAMLLSTAVMELLVLFEAPPWIADPAFAGSDFPDWAAESENYNSCDVQFMRWPRAFVLLLEGSLTANGFFDCVSQSRKPIQGTVLMYGRRRRLARTAPAASLPAACVCVTRRTWAVPTP